MAAIQQAFRFYADGTESGSLAIDSQNADITPNCSSDFDFQLRVRLYEDLDDFGAGSNWRLQYSKNSGTWTNVTTSSSNVKGFNSSNLTEGQATTERLTGGSGSWQAGKCSEDGEVNSVMLLTPSYTEFVYSLTIVAADVAEDDTLDFRVLKDGSSITYSVTPRATATKTGGGGGGSGSPSLLLLGVG